MNTYACVHCGHEVKELYKKYSPSVLKLMHCNSCDNVADKYIGYDNVIIIIDIILFKREAYRHILYNTEFKNHWKLSILLWLMKSYVKCLDVSPDRQSSTIVREHLFYICSLIILLGVISYLAVVISGLKVYGSLSTSNLSASHLRVWKALVLSNFGQFLMLPALIWFDVQKQIHGCFVLIYCLLSQIQALSVVCAAPKSFLFILLATAIAVDMFVTSSDTAQMILK